MKGLKLNLLLACLTLPLMALKHDPWILPPYELQAEVNYHYSYFPSVNNGTNPSKFASFENQLNLLVGGSATPQIYAEIEFAFDNSTAFQAFAFESVAPSVNYQCLDDLQGDPVALMVGTHFRYVPTDQLSDLTTPYAGSYNFDFMFSVGKEFDKGESILGRVYGMFDVGIATVGKPWINADITALAYFMERNIFIMGVTGYFGFGKQVLLNVSNFNGYGQIKHRSMEIKIGYKYDFPVWGALRAVYKRRVYAVSYPQDLDFISIAYVLNFSF